MKKLLYILALTTVLSACRKENNAINFQGTYAGTFKVIATSPAIETQIKLSRNNFKVEKGIKLGSGYFKVESKKTVVFKDTNVWTADFDANLVLSGSYTYEALGDSLILTKDFEGMTQPSDNYQYKLKRIQR